MRATSYAYRQSTDPLLSQYWVVHQLPLSKQRPVAVVTCEEEAKRIAKDYFRVEVYELINMIVGNECMNNVAAFINSAFLDGFSITQTAERYFCAHMVDTRLLSGISGKVEDACTEIRKLNRPYMAISNDVYNALMKQPYDYYLSAGGAVMTFGKAQCTNSDYEYALMPLNTAAANKVLGLNRTTNKA